MIKTNYLMLYRRLNKFMSYSYRKKTYMSQILIKNFYKGILIIKAAHKVSQTALCFDNGSAFLNFTASKR